MEALLPALRASPGFCPDVVRTYPLLCLPLGFVVALLCESVGDSMAVMQHFTGTCGFTAWLRSSGSETATRSSLRTDSFRSFLTLPRRAPPSAALAGLGTLRHAPAGERGRPVCYLPCTQTASGQSQQRPPAAFTGLAPSSLPPLTC